MTQRSLFIFCLIVCSAGLAAAQSVTNADLEKYKQARLKAESDYRENYRKWGFPSPEELDRQRQQSSVEAEQLSAKLRSDRLAREKIEAERRAKERVTAAPYGYQGFESQWPNYWYGYGYGTYWGYGRRHRPRVTPHYGSGYFAGGQFWPTPGSQTRSAPMWIQK